MRWPLRHQILLPFAVMTLVVVTAISLFSAYLATRQAERRVDVRVRRLGRTLLAASFPLTDAVLEQMHGLSGAHFVLMSDAGRVLASSRLSRRDLRLTTPAVSDWRRLSLGLPVRVGDDRYFASALSIADPKLNRQPSTLHILYPESHWSDSRREAALPPLVGGVATLLVSVLLSALIAGRISRPVGRLQQQVVRLANADYGTVPLPERDDELRDLALSVNLLAEKLGQMRRAIQRAERLTLLGRLSGALAHHLRNDITGTRMAVQLHQRNCDADDRESLAVALRQLELTEQHLQRLLVAGQPQEPRRAECDLLEIVEHVARLVEPSCRHLGVALSFAPARAAENGHDGFRLMADADQLRHLLMNLTANAIEAAGAGGWVRIELETVDAGLALRVFDSGPGPTAAMEIQLFEAFATTKAEGVGLGLAAARQIAESHGGGLSFMRRGDATCFELFLPRPEPGDDAPREEKTWLTC